MSTSTIPGVTKDRLRLTARIIEDNEYIPLVPTLRQLEFLAAPQREKGYGGAAGPGKSTALLMQALMYVKQPSYAALILRKTFPDLAQPGAIMNTAKEWLVGKLGVKWNERDKIFYFTPWKSQLQFGFLKSEDDKFRYQSAEFQTICFDEATQFPWSQYSYLRSRLRRSDRVRVPPTLACATNPGGLGHNWFYNWFVKGDGRRRVFISGRMADNPHLKTEEYVELLKDLDEITRRQLILGEWITDDSSKPFKREFWDDKNRYLPGGVSLDPRRVLGRKFFIDTPFTGKSTAAYYALVILELMSDYRVRVRHVWRDKVTFPTFVSYVVDWAQDYNYDGKLDEIVVESKANGPALHETIRDGQDPLTRHLIRAYMPVGSKNERYHQSALWCERDCVELPYVTDNNAPEMFAFEEEIYEAPESDYLDQADAFSMGVIFMEHLISRGYWWRQQMLAEGMKV